MRKLASIQEIINIEPIEGADSIEVATVNNWKIVVKKNEFKIGEKVIYLEIDSFLPIKPEFEFLRKSSYKKMGDLEGFRLKTIKLKGQISQGLVLPISVLNLNYNLDIDTDVSKELDIIKYEPPLPTQLQGKVKGNFPSFIPKTDEERIQNLTNQYKYYKDYVYACTEKLDGSSMTVYFNNGCFGVCSRNIDLLEDNENTFWKVANLYDLKNKLKVNLAIQGELLGPGIQGNKYNLKNPDFFVFSIFDINTQKYITGEYFNQFVKSLGLKTVPFLSYSILPKSIEDLLLIADGFSVLNPTVLREGIVFHSDNREKHFKVISNKWLLQNGN